MTDTTPSTAVLGMLFAVSLKALLLVALAACVAIALRRASAASRHVLWTAAVAGVLIVAVTAPLPSVWAFPFGASSVFSRLESSGVAEVLTPRPGRGTEIVPRGNAPVLPGGTVPQAPRGSGLPDGLVVVWLAGVVGFTTRILIGRLALRGVSARARAIEVGDARRVVERAAGSSRLLRRLRVISTDELVVPATWGIVRPVIALPRAAEAWLPVRLDAALLHELAHVRRLDALTQLGADVCCALLWFHPAVWIAARRMQAERERACDDAVLSAGIADLDYAEGLLALATDVSRRGLRSARAAVTMADAQELEDRVRAALDPRVTRSSRPIAMVSIPLIALLATACTAGLDVWGVAAARTTRVETVESGTALPDGEEIQWGERVPLSPEQERRALTRTFRPRNGRDALALSRLRAAADHVPLHAQDLVRGRAIWALAIATEGGVIDPLIESLASPDWRVRGYAAWTLGFIGVPEAREDLAERLRDPVWRVRASAAEALTSFGDPRSTEDMLAAIADPAWQVRMPAVEFLSHIRTPEARAAVRARLDDPHVAVRTAAQAAVENFESSHGR
ncbi:MAG: M56 family metallopeptidase [Candidatus Eiseniibacteriota bacterium]